MNSRARTPDTNAPVKAAGVPPAPRAEDAVRLLIPLGTALVLGLFVALGIEGDVRERFIRNQPGHVLLAFTLVLVGLTLPVLLARPGKVSRWPPVIGGTLVLLGAVFALYAGSASISDREQPDLEMTTARVEGQPGVVDVVITSTGLSLASRDKMLLRVLAVRPTASELVWSVCPSFPVPGRELDRPGVAATARTEPEPVRTVHWGGIGSGCDGRDVHGGVLPPLLRRVLPRLRVRSTDLAGHQQRGSGSSESRGTLRRQHHRPA